MKFLIFFILLWVIFALLDPDPDSKYGFGSTDLIESGSNTDPIPKHCHPDPQHGKIPWKIVASAVIVLFNSFVFSLSSSKSFLTIFFCIVFFLSVAVVFAHPRAKILKNTSYTECQTKYIKYAMTWPSSKQSGSITDKIVTLSEL